MIALVQPQNRSPVITTFVEPLSIDLFGLGWHGQWDADQQPIDTSGRRLARNYVRIGEPGAGGLRVYPPRLMGTSPGRRAGPCTPIHVDPASGTNASCQS